MPVGRAGVEKEDLLYPIPEPTYGEWEAIQIDPEVELEHLVKSGGFKFRNRILCL